MQNLLTKKNQKVPITQTCMNCKTNKKITFSKSTNFMRYQVYTELNVGEGLEFIIHAFSSH